MSAVSLCAPYAQAEKFVDDGFYAFRDPLTGAFRVMWAEHHGGGITLSDTRHSPIELVVSGEQFDEACWGIFLKVDEHGTPIQRRRH